MPQLAQIASTLSAVILAWCLTCCAGYQLGASKPESLKDIKSLHIPTFKNDTQFPRAGALATNSAIDAFTRDGTYTISTANAADATLTVTIKRINYKQIRSSIDDSLRSEEIEMRVHLDWEVTSFKNNVRTQLMKGSTTGRTRIFLGDNLQTTRANGLTNALNRASNSLVARLSFSF